MKYFVFTNILYIFALIIYKFSPKENKLLQLIQFYNFNY